MVELIIVISIIGILSTVLIVLINPQLQISRANDGKRKSELRQIQAALELYRSDVGGYPIDVTSSLVNPDDPSVVYLQAVPKDPKSNADYYYCTDTSCGAPTTCSAEPCSSYALYACSEQGSKDKDAMTPLPSGMSCPSGVSYDYQTISP